MFQIKINKQNLIDVLEESGFMKGVNKGFHESPLPAFAIKNYSNIDTLKPALKQKDEAISYDLGLRVGSQILAKGTVGGLVYGGMRSLENTYNDSNPDEAIDLDGQQSKILASIPAIASAWIASDKLQNYLPTAHKKLFGNKSIYK